jgi:hypothetical protein
MDSWYPIALFIHVTSAMMLAAGLGIMTVCEFRVGTAWTLEELRRWVGLADKTGKALGAVAPVLLLSALYLVHLRWGFGQAWVVMALIAFLVMAISGRALIGSRLYAILEAAITAGSVSPAIRAMIEDPLLRWHPWVRVGVFSWLLFLMTTKPGLQGAVVSLIFGLGFSVVLGVMNRAADGRAESSRAFETR